MYVCMCAYVAVTFLASEMHKITNNILQVYENITTYYTFRVRVVSYNGKWTP